MMLTRIGVLMIVVLTATGVSAQVIEIQPFAAYVSVEDSLCGGRSRAAIETSPSTSSPASPGAQRLDFSWGTWPRSSPVEPPGERDCRRANSGIQTTLFDVSMSQYTGNLLFHFFRRDSRMRPCILIGAGGTKVDPDAGDLEGTTQFSLGLGAGLKAYMSGRVGARIQFRYAPTYVSALPALWCDVFSSCQAVGVADYAKQAEISAGLMFRF